MKMMDKKMKKYRKSSSKKCQMCKNVENEFNKFKSNRINNSSQNHTKSGNLSTFQTQTPSEISFKFVRDLFISSSFSRPLFQVFFNLVTIVKISFSPICQNKLTHL
jgi:hypothetical protein